mgnify:CR=1 FL=1
MVDRWWKALRGRALRRSVLALLCVSIFSAFVVEVHTHTAHAVHAVHHHESEALAAASDHAIVDVDPDRQKHENVRTDNGSKGEHPAKSSCEHSHSCFALVLPKGLGSGLAALVRIRHLNGLDKQLTGLPSPSFDRPPIAIL